jgi:Fic family protein
VAAKQPQETRSGLFVPHGDGYSAFFPKPLPPDPPLDLTPELLTLLERAGTDLGRLDGIARLAPDPDFFVSMYVRREAVLSSQIGGTQSTLRTCSSGRSAPAPTTTAPTSSTSSTTCGR